ncbi:hypothetical protein CS542_06805 [Pedobacter sp. IW39]|nr:hypothetical protein CS542_06805 [Pedobacter sp. IW39]
MLRFRQIFRNGRGKVTGKRVGIILVYLRSAHLPMFAKCAVVIDSSFIIQFPVAAPVHNQVITGTEGFNQV